VNQAQALIARWQRLGDDAALDRATAVHEEIAAGLPDDVDEQVAVARAELWWERYALTGAPALLDEMEATLRPVVATVPDDVPIWRTAALDLATALLERRWTPGDDEELTSLLGRIGRVTRAGTPNVARLRHLDGLRAWQDYLTSGALAALDDAVAAWRTAAESAPDGDTTAGIVLNSLAIGVLQRAKHDPPGATAIARAEEAVAAARQAVRASPSGSQTEAAAWNTLGHALGLRHRQTGRFEDVAAAVDAWRTAVRLSPPGSRGRAGHLGSLAAGLRERAAARDDGRATDDLREAVSLHREAVHLMAGTIELPGLLTELGMTLHGLAATTHDVAAYQEARETLRAAVTTGLEVAAGQALDGALAWRRLALDGSEVVPDVAEAADAALAALHKLVRTQLFRPDKEAWLRTTVDVTASAAAAHARLGRPRSAVTSVESGRGLLLVEALPPVGLERVRPELFERFVRASRAVDTLEQSVERRRAADASSAGPAREWS
jgi:tetratricopeptide (TPR) repeat protein